MENELTAVISVRVTKELKRAVEREARRRYLRPTDLIRRTLSDLVLPENKKETEVQKNV